MIALRMGGCRNPDKWTKPSLGLEKEELIPELSPEVEGQGLQAISQPPGSPPPIHPLESIPPAIIVFLNNQTMLLPA